MEAQAHAPAAAIPAADRHRSVRRRVWTSHVAAGVCLLLALAAVWPLLSVLWTVIDRGHASLSWEFFTEPPRQTFSMETFTIEYGGGVQHAIVGTGLVVAIGTAIGAPVGILGGIFLSESGRNRFGDAVRTFTDAMVGIPSIAAGLFSYAVIVSRFGYSAWAGGVALSILMMPVVARTTEEALRTVPQALRDASLALGAPNWYTAVRVVLPAAWGAVTTGLLLSVSRIAGETAPLLLTTLASNFLVKDPGQPVTTLPALVYNYGKSASPEENAFAWGAALVLIGGVLLVNVAVRLLSRPRTP